MTLYEKIFEALCGLAENQNKTPSQIKALAKQCEREGWIVDGEGDLMQPNGDAYYGKDTPVNEGDMFMV